MSRIVLIILMTLAFAALTVGPGAVPASAAQFRAFLPDTARDTDPAPSPDGKWVAFQSNRGGSSQIWIVPTAGGAPRKITNDPAKVKGPDGKMLPTRVMTPTWAPDSKSLLYVSTREGNYNVYSIPLEGQFEQTLNALYLQHLGYGEYHRTLSERSIAGFLERSGDYRQKLKAHKQDRNKAILAAVDELIELVERTGRVVQPGEMGDGED